MNEAWPAVCKAYGLDVEDKELREHFNVLMDALCVHGSRSQRYGLAWRHYGWMDSLFHMRSRMARLITEFGPDRPMSEFFHDSDDARDMINLCVFFIRNVRSGIRGPGVLWL